VFSRSVWSHKILNYFSSYLEACIYPENAFDGHFKLLPGERIEKLLAKISTDNIAIDLLERKLHQSCHKLCLMWKAGKHSIEAEKEFYALTYNSSPALYGNDAIKVNYHLEALVFFARSSLDIASTIFGYLLPEPFTKKRYDSFNKLVKGITVGDDRIEIAPYFEKLRENQESWLSIISNTNRGRSLRDKIAHQMDFPIDYIELDPLSERRRAIVWVDQDRYLPLLEFVQNLKFGVIECFLLMENICIKNF
jgi:hypothetical protein